MSIYLYIHLQGSCFQSVHREAQVVEGFLVVAEASGHGARVTEVILREVTESCFVCCHYFWEDV